MKYALPIALFLLLFFPSQSIFAQTVSPSPTLSPHQEEIQNVNYSLPYPGLLPTSPLYFLKTLRDRMVSFFIADPKKKAEFDILQADKRLAAGMYLLPGDKRQQSLAADTISKGENYFFMALEEAKSAKMQGENITDVTAHLKNAALKHQQVLENLETITQEPWRGELVAEERRVANFENSAKQLENGK